ncbi:hypothetical protein QE152_g35325 [Popillia japonica]|uniref:Uncharacterized protein n=1 Tax=Popillia japonica TaxID=7064 RepID=A0AAW1IG29_POPJA
MIENADENNEIKINILHTVMISTAWEAVLQNTIVNCLPHAGFLPSVAIQEDDHFENENNIPLAQLILEAYVVDTDSNVTFDDFVDVDKDLATSGELNDEDLVINSKSLQTEEEAYEIDENQDNPGMEFEPPSTLEAIKALKIVRNHISFNDKLKEVYIKNVIILERAYVL